MQMILTIKNVGEKRFKILVSLRGNQKLMADKKLLGEQLRLTHVFLGRLDKYNVINKLILFDIVQKKYVLATERTGQMLGNLLILGTVELTDSELCSVMMALKSAAMEVGIDCKFPIAA